MASSTVLLEHLLEHHTTRMAPLFLAELNLGDFRSAKAVASCWNFGNGRTKRRIQGMIDEAKRRFKRGAEADDTCSADRQIEAPISAWLAAERLAVSRTRKMAWTHYRLTVERFSHIDADFVKATSNLSPEGGTAELVVRFYPWWRTSPIHGC